MMVCEKGCVSPPVASAMCHACHPLSCANSRKLEEGAHGKMPHAPQIMHMNDRNARLVIDKVPACTTASVLGELAAHLAAKTSPALFTRQMPTERLCSSRSLLLEALAASPGCLKTSLEEHWMEGALLTHACPADLMRFKEARLCIFRPRLAPSARHGCCKPRIVAVKFL
jgi:hypothetical protein